MQLCELLAAHGATMKLQNILVHNDYSPLLNTFGA